MSAMANAKLWPGQIEEGLFTLEQLRALSSVARAEVFWAFSSLEPRSTKEVAAAIRRTPPTVRYHTNELIKVGLLLAVETRKRRSRTEEAYVHRLARGYTPRPPFSKEYREEMNRGLGAILRSIEQERAAALVVCNEDGDYYNWISFRHIYVRLRPEKIAEMRKKLHEVIYMYLDDDDPDGIAMHGVGYLAPVVSESRSRYMELTGNELANGDEE